ncbi:TetR/AcrR family transcriptional regulator [Anaerovorax odorimutans]|uniref:TetR/AcrR family transcriptional regulator n=1 Tax=Anaerovorax odorimutans TaxID=109327 RepID=A0ABT1RLZ0_9FIRM|nr:TetR/AcrR family transcriptional regulator [Anaerovorax odorimutans]MCQ4636211.1 TetR/AcrR family transcriptional regulator [Anaerovorax odorimutans]
MKSARNTKQEIVNASLELFASKGYGGTSMNDIISAVGISKGSVYWHFKSKEEIFMQVITENYAEWIDLLNRELAVIDNPIDKLRKYGELFIATIDMPVWRISPETYWNEFSAENREILDACFSQDDIIIRQIFQDAIDRDLIIGDNSEKLMWIYISSLEGMFEKIILSYKNHDHNCETLEQYAASGIELFLSTIQK